MGLSGIQCTEIAKRLDPQHTAALSEAAQTRLKTRDPQLAASKTQRPNRLTKLVQRLPECIFAGQWLKSRYAARGLLH